MAMISKAMPKFSQRACASVMLLSAVYLEGMETQRTFSGPRASAAMAAVRAESMPPERPMTTWEKPLFRT